MGEGANENAFLIIMTARIVCLRYKIEREYLVLQHNYYYFLNILFYTLIDHLYLLIYQLNLKALLLIISFLLFISSLQIDGPHSCGWI